MTEERLQEIKDSVEFQYALAKAKGVDNALLFTNEEEELIEEVERLQKENRHNQEIIIKDSKELYKLHSIIKEVRELVNKEEFTMKQKYEMREELLEILDKVGETDDSKRNL